MKMIITGAVENVGNILKPNILIYAATELTDFNNSYHFSTTLVSLFDSSLILTVTFIIMYATLSKGAQRNFNIAIRRITKDYKVI